MSLTQKQIELELTRRKATDKAIRANGRKEAIASGAFKLSRKELKVALTKFVGEEAANAKVPAKAFPVKKTTKRVGALHAVKA